MKEELTRHQSYLLFALQTSKPIVVLCAQLNFHCHFFSINTFILEDFFFLSYQNLYKYIEPLSNSLSFWDYWSYSQNLYHWIRVEHDAFVSLLWCLTKNIYIVLVLHLGWDHTLVFNLHVKPELVKSSYDVGTINYPIKIFISFSGEGSCWPPHISYSSCSTSPSPWNHLKWNWSKITYTCSRFLHPFENPKWFGLQRDSISPFDHLYFFFFQSNKKKKKKTLLTRTKTDRYTRSFVSKQTKKIKFRRSGSNLKMKRFDGTR